MYKRQFGLRCAHVYQLPCVDSTLLNQSTWCAQLTVLTHTHMHTAHTFSMCKVHSPISETFHHFCLSYFFFLPLSRESKRPQFHEATEKKIAVLLITKKLAYSFFGSDSSKTPFNRKIITKAGAASFYFGWPEKPIQSY